MSLASASVARAGCFDAARSAQALLDAYRDAHLGRPQPGGATAAPSEIAANAHEHPGAVPPLRPRHRPHRRG
ncbi:MAG: hypothetical protein R2749_29435 [Acidimicrobiales bacterium]